MWVINRLSWCQRISQKSREISLLIFTESRQHAAAPSLSRCNLEDDHLARFGARWAVAFTPDLSDTSGTVAFACDMFLGSPRA